MFSGIIVLSVLSVWSSSAFQFPHMRNYGRGDGEYRHLDQSTMEKLEKMFYLKNRRYSPYKNKYQTQTTVNVTEMLENLNREFLKNMAEQQQRLQDEDEDLDLDDFYGLGMGDGGAFGFGDLESDLEGLEEDTGVDQREMRNQKRRKQSDLGYIDPMGVYRYKNPTIVISTGGGGPGGARSRSRGGSSNGGDEFSGEGNFQILLNPEYTFQDVGGYQKIKDELLQISDILLNYEKYAQYNVRTPKGIIFEGPPGNGKTLMAKGFSGELNVSFIPVSGSEFSEKYVGVGAMRVRELFKLAEENKPCIVFIDEIDALARKRGADSVSSNSEKDQTLNQLLISLDGFKQSNGIFVIGATNRVDLLDAALMRPGRMDKNIFMGNPDSDTRRAILQIHSEGKPMDSQINMNMLVEMTGGFSGAQIENLLNESMLRALREGRTQISLEDLEYIMNRILAGWQSTESKYSEDIIKRIVIHEMGHAVVGFLCKQHPKLVKVCLNLWSPKSPGYTVFESSEENINIYTKDGLFSHLMVLLGGRIAEELFFGYSVTTGARKDLDEAYKLAQSMILQYGMGKQNIYPDLSDQSKYLIDQEVNQLLMMANDEAAKIISNSREFLLETSEILKRDSLLKPEQMEELLKAKYPMLMETYHTS